MPDFPMSLMRALGWAAVIVGLALIILSAPRAQDCVFGAYGCGHQENHEKYMGWHREPTAEQKANGMKGMHCCKEGDCRPTRATKGNPERGGEDEDSWYAWTGNYWRRVPEHALLKPDILGDGRAHVCAPPDPSELIYCFSPSQPKG